MEHNRNDEYESDGSEGSETEGEDDEEPKLKYQRLGDSVKVILERDSATCMTVHEKFLVCYPRTSSSFCHYANRLQLDSWYSIGASLCIRH